MSRLPPNKVGAKPTAASTGPANPARPAALPGAKAQAPVAKQAAWQTAAKSPPPIKMGAKRAPAPTFSFPDIEPDTPPGSPPGSPKPQPKSGAKPPSKPAPTPLGSPKAPQKSGLKPPTTPAPTPPKGPAKK